MKRNLAFTPVRALVVAAALLVVACQLILDVDRLRPDPDVDGGVVDPCTHATPPPVPPGADDPSGDQTYTFATQQIIVPLREVNGFKPGIDLDDSCTCRPDLHDGAPPCKTPSPTAPVACDFDGGVDDAFAVLSLAYADFLPGGNDLAETSNRGIASGRQTFLVYISGYNGKANDPLVNAAIVLSGGLFDDSRCGEPGKKIADADRESLRHAPRWDGCDRWSPPPGAFQDFYPRRRTVVFQGYVSNFTLVVKPELIDVEVLGTRLALRGGAAVAKFIPEPGGGFRLEGYMTGRIDANAAARIVGGTEIQQGSGELALCASPFWNTVASQLCASRDTVLDKGNEFTGRVCDAMTLTLGFVARPAQVADDEYTPIQRFLPCDASVVCP